MKQYISTVLLCVLLFACQEEENTPDEQTSLSELIARTWRVQAVTVDEVAEDAAGYNTYRFTFSQDQTYRFLMPDELTGNWELTSNGNLLTLDRGTDQEQTVRVLSLSADALNLEFSIEDEKTGLSIIVYELVP